MTKAELIKELEDCPDNAIIVIYDNVYDIYELLRIGRATNGEEAIITLCPGKIIPIIRKNDKG